MSHVEQILELDRLLARERMILQQLQIHYDDLAPGTSAATHASSRIAEAVRMVRSLEAKKYALIAEPVCRYFISSTELGLVGGRGSLDDAGRMVCAAATVPRRFYLLSRLRTGVL